MARPHESAAIGGPERHAARARQQYREDDADQETGSGHLGPREIAAGQSGAYVHHREARLREQHPAETGQVMGGGLRVGNVVNHGHGGGTYMHRQPAR